MKIHKDLLTHDGALSGTGMTVGKVIDLGFNGDFDRKKTDWNMVFVQFPAKASGTDMTVKACSVQSTIANITDASNVIGTLVIPAATVQAGGVVGIPMPRNLKRYFTLVISGTAATLPATATAGITDEVDTDLAVIDNGSYVWANYKAVTGTSEVADKAKYVGDVISGEVDSRIDALEDAASA